jgi:hypothetical protein
VIVARTVHVVGKRACNIPYQISASGPPLEWEQWKDTAETLHMYMQIVGKARLGLTPIQNHWWNIAFYLTVRGLTTSAMPADRGMSLDIEFDLLSHEVVCRTSHGEIRNIPLRPVSVAHS